MAPKAIVARQDEKQRHFPRVPETMAPGPAGLRFFISSRVPRGSHTQLLTAGRHSLDIRPLMARFPLGDALNGLLVVSPATWRGLLLAP